MFCGFSSVYQNFPLFSSQRASVTLDPYCAAAVASRHTHTALPRWRASVTLDPFLSLPRQIQRAKAKRVLAVRPPDRSRARQQNQGRLYAEQQRSPPCAKGGGGLRRRGDWQRDAAPKRCSRTRSQHPAESFAWLHNPPCMALPCCPPFAQGGLQRDAAPISRCRAGPVVYRKAKKVWPSGHRTQDCRLALTGVGSPAPEQ